MCRDLFASKKSCCELCQERLQLEENFTTKLPGCSWCRHTSSCSQTCSCLPQPSHLQDLLLCMSATYSCTINPVTRNREYRTSVASTSDMSYTAVGLMEGLQFRAHQARCLLSCLCLSSAFCTSSMKTRFLLSSFPLREWRPATDPLKPLLWSLWLSGAPA